MTQIRVVVLSFPTVFRGEGSHYETSWRTPSPLAGGVGVGRRAAGRSPAPQRARVLHADDGFRPPVLARSGSRARSRHLPSRFDAVPGPRRVVGPTRGR